MHPLNLRLIATATVFCALPAFAQDAAPNEPLPPTTVEDLPPAGEAPVDAIAPISDVAPDGGMPDATATRLNCNFTSQCTDGACEESSYPGTLTVMSDGAGLAEAEWEDDLGPMAFSAVLAEGIVRAYSTENSSEDSSDLLQHMMTVDTDRNAVYTVQETYPVRAISYTGSCEVAQ